MRPRFALLGDAAHGIHPIAGQGLNLGFRDAAALAETVVDAYRLGLDIGSLDVLRRYESWRRYDTFQMGVTTDVLNRLFSNDIAPLRALRDIGLGIVDRLPKLKEMFIGEAAGFGGELPKLLRGEAIWIGSRTDIQAAGQPSSSPRLFLQHDWNAVADWEGKLGRVADQLLPLAIIFERGLGDRADQDLEELRVDRAAGPRFAFSHSASFASLQRRRGGIRRRQGPSR